MDGSLPGSSVQGILQARILEWVAIPFSRGSSWPMDWTRVSCIVGRFFTVFWATRGSLPNKYPAHEALPWRPLLQNSAWNIKWNEIRSPPSGSSRLALCSTCGSMQSSLAPGSEVIILLSGEGNWGQPGWRPGLKSLNKLSDRAGPGTWLGGNSQVCASQGQTGGMWYLDGGADRLRKGKT